MNINLIVSNINSFISSACDDMANNYVDINTGEIIQSYMSDTIIINKLNDAKIQGVTDLHGWLADVFYNDTDLLHSLISDNLDMYCSDKSLQIQVLEALGSQHPALANAVTKLIKFKEQYG